MISSLFYPYYQLTLFGVTLISYLPIFKILLFWIRPRAVHALYDLSSEFHPPAVKKRVFLKVAMRTETDRTESN